MISAISGAAFKEMILSGAALIDKNKEYINALNVFPVPDGDTGTNMSLTINAGAAELRKLESGSVSQIADKAASALLRGARGNSGVILSLLFRGMAKSLKGLQEAGAADLAAALAEGVATAYSAVMKPTEGTILTVSRLSAEAAKASSKEDPDVIAMLEAVMTAGNKALADTIEMNPVLKKAGVVDAGGQGFMDLISGMLSSLKGEPVTAEAGTAQSSAAASVFSGFETEDIRFAYCTEFIVGKENHKDVNLLRSYLTGIGDCVVVVEDEEIIKVHVHNNVPGNVLTEALTYGQLLTVKIENMRQQHTAILESGNEPEQEPAVAEAVKPYGVAAVCAGAGLDELFRELGADQTITGGQTMNPSTEDILSAVNRTPSETVFVLPNNKNIIMAAQQCVGLTEKNVIVIPSRSIPQGITALMNYDESMDARALTETLTESAASVHTVQITYAARDSDFDGHKIAAGEYLALLESALIANSADLNVILSAVAEKLGEFEPEFVNVYYGEDVSEDAAAEVADFLKSGLPDAELDVVSGGQPVYYYIISAE